MGQFSRRLRALRLALGIPQWRLADKAGVSRQAVTNWEAGIREPDYETLVKMSEVAKIPAGFLLGQKEADLRPFLALLNLDNPEKIRRTAIEAAYDALSEVGGGAAADPRPKTYEQKLMLLRAWWAAARDVASSYQ